jgi:hypothetical protein
VLHRQQKNTMKLGSLKLQSIKGGGLNQTQNGIEWYRQEIVWRLIQKSVFTY